MNWKRSSVVFDPYRNSFLAQKSFLAQNMFSLAIYLTLLPEQIPKNIIQQQFSFSFKEIKLVPTCSNSLLWLPR